MRVYPPSLSPQLLARTFRAPNGELGIPLADVEEFLGACDRDSVAVLGWELWLVDHFGDFDGNLKPSKGQWYGLIPMLNSEVPGVFSFDGDSADARRQIAEQDISNAIDVRWQPYLRINFSLED
jgi:hypothetical protein